MQWERILPLEFLRSNKENPGQTLQGLETILKGMENALENCFEFPVGVMSSELKHDMISLQDQILNQIKSIALENSIVPEKNNNKFLQTLHAPSMSIKHLPCFFFIFCLKLLHTKSSPNLSSKQSSDNSKEKKNWFFTELWSSSPITINKRRLMPALKCSLSLGFAILFGLIYSKENGFWSGLPVAISLAAAREATFKVANIKAQGTVLGTVYGVIGCFVFERYIKIRFISLLPWFVFCTFLRQSKMYGQAGGVSAVIGAVLILGRKNFGAASDFAIARIVETFIGLSCSIMVDILLQPTRAAVMAKAEVSMSLQALQESIGSISLAGSNNEESLRKLKSHLNELGKFIEEAEVEPCFWFLPFHSACYSKLKLSLSRMVDFLLFTGQALRLLEQESKKIDEKIWKEAASKMETDLSMLKDAACSGIKCFGDVISLIKPIAIVEREYEKRKSSVDLEMGKSGKRYAIQWTGSDDAIEDEIVKSTNAFLRHLDEVVSRIGEEEVRNEVALSLSAVVYCMNGVLKESREIEKAVKECVQWENPSSPVDLHDISCKLRALDKNLTI